MQPSSKMSRNEHFVILKRVHPGMCGTPTLQHVGRAGVPKQMGMNALLETGALPCVSAEISNRPLVPPTFAQMELDDEAILQGPPEALDPAFGLRRASRDVPDPELPQDAAELGRMLGALQFFVE